MKSPMITISSSVPQEVLPWYSPHWPTSLAAPKESQFISHTVCMYTHGCHVHCDGKFVLHNHSIFASRRQETLDPDAASYDDAVTLDDDFKGDGTYTLERIRCTSLRDLLSRLHRSVDELYFDESNLVKDSIVARIDPGSFQHVIVYIHACLVYMYK